MHIKKLSRLTAIKISSHVHLENNVNGAQKTTAKHHFSSENISLYVKTGSLATQTLTNSQNRSHENYKYSILTLKTLLVQRTAKMLPNRLHGAQYKHFNWKFRKCYYHGLQVWSPAFTFALFCNPATKSVHVIMLNPSYSFKWFQHKRNSMRN